MYEFRRSVSPADFVRGLHLAADPAGMSDRVVGGLLTFVLSLALAGMLIVMAVNPPHEAPPPPIMVRVLAEKVNPPPKMTFKMTFLKVPVPVVLPPDFAISPNAMLSRTAPPATTDDPAYLAQVAQSLAHAFDPASVHGQGVVYVQFIIDPAGHLLFLGVAKSSGSAALDQAALAQVQRAQPLPGFPASVHAEMLYLMLPVCFKAGKSGC